MDQQSPHAMAETFLIKNLSELELAKNLQQWPVLSLKGKMFPLHKMVFQNISFNILESAATVSHL